MITLFVGWLLGLLTLLLWELRARRQRWRVQRVVKIDDARRPAVHIYVTKGKESVKLNQIGINREKSTRPDMSFDDALADAIIEARVKRDVLNAIDRNLQKHS